MPRSLAGVRNIPRSPSTYSLPPGTTPQVPNTVISSSMFTAFADDVAQTFNTVQPIVYGGTGSNDLKLTDTDFGIKDNGDPTKIGQFNASNLPTATTRTYDLPYYSGTLGLVSDIRGQIYGLTLSNNVTDATNDIDIAAGSAVDSTGAVSMLLASSMTKRLDAAWAVGTGNGGLDTGSIANTWYAVYVIRRPDTGVVDAIFSANLTTPTLPTNYTQYRRIGYIHRASGSIVSFLQFGDEFLYFAARSVVASTTVGTAISAFTLDLPPLVTAKLRISGFAAGSQTLIYVGTSGTANATPNVPTGNYSIVTPSAGVGAADSLDIRLSAASGIFAKASVDNTNFNAVAYGWIDSRGRV